MKTRQRKQRGSNIALSREEYCTIKEKILWKAKGRERTGKALNNITKHKENKTEK